MISSLFMVDSLGMVMPSFDNFLQRSTGSWRGVGFTWSPQEPSDGLALPLGVVKGYITPPAESSSEISEVMRSCGGAVQGVREERQPSGGSVMLNRQTDGFTFFSDGSFAEVPASLADGTGGDFDAVGLSVCLAHGDDSRRRLLLVIVNGELTACDVAVEGRAALPASAQTLLDGKLQVMVDANAWEGGATATELEATPPEGAPWNNARTQWARATDAVSGGSPLLPQEAAFLPGGCYVTVVDQRASGGTLQVEAGSVAAEAAEVKLMRHEWGSDGALARLAFRTIVADE